ncbi:hypothetical protein DL769_008103 [Monosporascus sp. CRB-8-3]|nr:hypothetical protein DL769_008103 [Monosporascus sp. CRB-8-3]
MASRPSRLARLTLRGPAAILHGFVPFFDDCRATVCAIQHQVYQVTLHNKTGTPNDVMAAGSNSSAQQQFTQSAVGLRKLFFGREPPPNCAFNIFRGRVTGDS